MTKWPLTTAAISARNIAKITSFRTFVPFFVLRLLRNLWNSQPFRVFARKKLSSILLVFKKYRKIKLITYIIEG